MDYDIAIIGGGIHGVGIAQAVAVRGYKTILIEQYNDLAQGTSSRSSKLIHGGLRYLEQFEFSLVRECLLERSYLLENAPDLVQLKPVYIPVYKDSKRPPWMIFAGLSMYALLGNLSSDARFKTVPKHKWNRLHGLNVNNLQAVFQYYEAQTDDALLTHAVMNSAQEYGAKLLLSTKVNAIELRDDHCELICKSKTETDKKITTKTIVNAAGPWASRVLENVQPKQKTVAVDLVQGTHCSSATSWRLDFLLRKP
jgi:glycerol-3-phosphate dehydrogenase